jgi:hypothetical protein
MAQNYQSYSDYGTPIPPVEPPYGEPPKRNTTRIILIVVVVLLVLCFCCIAFAAIMYFWLGDIITDALGITRWLLPWLSSM